ncbi:unnamed protein product [Amoebophrya sp. A120]|nr:unnamed protein product [Amoebophrya sp. A120]|eukprot:GSA120T00022302001.1
MNDYTRYRAAVTHPNKTLDKMIRHEEMQRMKTRVRNASPEKAVTLDLGRIHVKKIEAYEKYLRHERLQRQQFHEHQQSLQSMKSRIQKSSAAVVIPARAMLLQQGTSTGSKSRSSSAPGTGNKKHKQGKKDHNSLKITGEKNRLALILGNIVQNLDNLSKNDAYQEDEQIRARINAIREKFTAIKTHMRYTQVHQVSSENVINDLKVRAAVAAGIRRAESIVAKQMTNASTMRVAGSGEVDFEPAQQEASLQGAPASSGVQQSQSQHPPGTPPFPATPPGRGAETAAVSTSGGAGGTQSGGENTAVAAQQENLNATNVTNAPATFADQPPVGPTFAAHQAVVPAGGSDQKQVLVVLTQPEKSSSSSSGNKKGKASASSSSINPKMGSSAGAKGTSSGSSSKDKKDGKNNPASSKEKPSAKEVCVLRHQAAVIQQQASVIQQQAQLIAQAVKNDQLHETGGMMAAALDVATNQAQRGRIMNNQAAATMAGKDFGTAANKAGGDHHKAAGGKKKQDKKDGKTGPLGKKNKYERAGSKSKLARVPEEASFSLASRAGTESVLHGEEEAEREPVEAETRPVSASEVVEQEPRTPPIPDNFNLEASPGGLEMTHVGGRAGPMAKDLVQNLVDGAIRNDADTPEDDRYGGREVIDSGDQLDSDRMQKSSPRVENQNTRHARRLASSQDTFQQVDRPPIDPSQQHQYYDHQTGAVAQVEGPHQAATTPDNLTSAQLESLDDENQRNSGRREQLVSTSTKKPGKNNDQQDDEDDNAQMEDEEDKVIEQFLVTQGIPAGFDYRASRIEDRFLRKQELEYDSPKRRRNDKATKLLLTDFREDLDQILHRLTRARAAQAVADFVEKAHSAEDDREFGDIFDREKDGIKQTEQDMDKLLIHQVLRLTESLGEVEKEFLQHTGDSPDGSPVGGDGAGTTTMSRNKQYQQVKVPSLSFPPAAAEEELPPEFAFNPFVRITVNNEHDLTNPGDLENFIVDIVCSDSSRTNPDGYAPDAAKNNSVSEEVLNEDVCIRRQFLEQNPETGEQTESAPAIVFHGNLKAWFKTAIGKTFGNDSSVEQIELEHLVRLIFRNFFSPVVYQAVWFSRFSEQGDANGATFGGTTGSPSPSGRKRAASSGSGAINAVEQHQNSVGYRMRIPLFIDSTKEVRVSTLDEAGADQQDGINNGEPAGAAPGVQQPSDSSRSGQSKTNSTPRSGRSNSRSPKKKRKRSNAGGSRGRKIGFDEVTQEEIIEQLVEISISPNVEQQAGDIKQAVQTWKKQHFFTDRCLVVKQNEASWVIITQHDTLNIARNLLLLPESPPDSVLVFSHRGQQDLSFLSGTDETQQQAAPGGALLEQKAVQALEQQELFRFTAPPRGSNEKTVLTQIETKLNKILVQVGGFAGTNLAASSSEWEPPDGGFDAGLGME